MYYHYIDDTFSIFDSEKNCNEFFHQLNSLNSLLCGLRLKKINLSLLFLDVQVKNVGSKRITPVYSKLTFTEQHLNWKFFSPEKKIS